MMGGPLLDFGEVADQADPFGAPRHRQDLGSRTSSTLTLGVGVAAGANGLSRNVGTEGHGCSQRASGSLVKLPALRAWLYARAV
jgi:hypothetical protein